MSIRTKIAIIVILTILSYAGFDLAVQRTVIGPSFASLERDEARKDLERAINALRREAHHLQQFCSDWAIWDTTYSYVQQPEPDYEQSILVPESFTDNDLFLIFILDSDGTVVWGQCYDAALNAPIRMRDFPQDVWPRDHPLLHREDPATFKRGLLNTERGIALLAASPILPSNAEGPVRGTLVMGRLLDDAMMELLIEQTQVQMSIEPLNTSTNAAGVSLTEYATYPEIMIQTVEENPGILLTQVVINDVSDSPAFVLRANFDREITRKGAEAIRLDAIGAFVIGLCLLLFLLVILHRMVTTPLLHLTNHVACITRGGALLPVNLGTRNDEFGTLAREFNIMVQRLSDDAAAKHEVEKALRDSETTLRAILQAAPDTIMVTNKDGIIESCNIVAEKTFGFAAENLIGRPLHTLFSQEDRALLERALSLMRHDPSEDMPHESFTLRGINAAGQQLPMHGAFGIAALADRRLFIGVFRDISELKRMHERIAKHQHLVKLGELGASVAHEIRNPIAGVSALLQNMHKQSTPNDPRRPALEEALAQISRVNNTVEQLLLFARPWKPRKTPCDLRRITQQVCDQIARTGRLESRALEVAAGDSLLVQADPLLLEQVLHNVLNNAMDATAPDGRIDVRVEKVDNAACIRIEDNGTGLSPELRDRVFDPFFTTKTRGTGLGLAICRRIMEAHDGDIRLAEGRQTGLCVELLLPRMDHT